MTSDADQMFSPADVTTVVPVFGPAEVVVRNRRAQPFYGRHPWVFAGAVDRITGAPSDGLKPGAAVRLVNSDGRFIAWGL